MKVPDVLKEIKGVTVEEVAWFNKVLRRLDTLNRWIKARNALQESYDNELQRVRQRAALLDVPADDAPAK